MIARNEMEKKGENEIKTLLSFDLSVIFHHFHLYIKLYSEEKVTSEKK